MRLSMRAISASLSAAITANVLGQILVQEVAQSVGVNITHATPVTWTIGLAFMTAGGACGDFNNDGLQDLFVISGGMTRDRLYINNGDDTFSEQSAQWGLSELHLGGGAAVGDYNNDGWLDIYVTSFGTPAAMATGAHRLYRNNGNGTFTNVATAAGVNYTNSVPDGFSPAFGDIDLDGDLDLFVTGWLTNGIGGNRLFRNNGNGTFTDITIGAGVYNPSVHGFSPRFVDIDGDRYPELLLAADFYTSRYYVNNGDNTFLDYTLQSGTGLDCNGMGATIGDFNNDGKFDWYVTAIWRGDTVPQAPCGNMLYMNTGGHQFTEVAAAANVNDGRWGWGTVAVDLDQDGWQDLIEVNGWSDDSFTDRWEDQPKRIYRNLADGTFEDVAAAAGFNHTGQGRGLLNFDYDQDGDQDYVVFAFHQPVTVYRNESATGNWLRVTIDTQGAPGLAPNGFGTRVHVRSNGMKQHRVIDGGANFLSQSELTAHFGLGSATTVDELRVEWANGAVWKIPSVAANQSITLRYLSPSAQTSVTAPASDPAPRGRAPRP